MIRQGLAYVLGFVLLFIGVNAVWSVIEGERPDLSGALLAKALAIGVIAAVVQYFILRKKSS